jgi:hypothetical protein
MKRWLPEGPAEPGTAVMPSLALLAFGARPAMSISSHAETMPQCSGPRLPKTGSGADHAV